MSQGYSLWSAVVLAFGLSTVAAQLPSNVISLPFERQGTNVWCWAAADKMIRTYWQGTDPIVPVTQCKIVQSIADGSGCCNNPAPNHCRFTCETTVMASGHGGRNQSGPLPYDQLRNQIDHGWPYITIRKYAVNGSRHASVVDGYSYWYNPDPYGQYVHELDPANSSAIWILYPYYTSKDGSTIDYNIVDINH